MKRLSLIFVFLIVTSCVGEVYTGTRGDTKLFLSDDVRKTLSSAYKDAEKEKPFCLFGKDREIDRVSSPKVTSSTDTTTTWEGDKCEEDTDFVGYVHNHDLAPVPSKMDSVRFALNNDSKVEVIAYQSFGEVKFYAYSLN